MSKEERLQHISKQVSYLSEVLGKKFVFAVVERPADKYSDIDLPAIVQIKRLDEDSGNLIDVFETDVHIMERVLDMFMLLLVK